MQDLDLPDGVAPAHRGSHRAASATMQKEFVAERPGRAGRRATAPPTSRAVSADALRRRARRSISTRSRPKLRDSYGRNLFGQGCLLARRLIERGVPFVEVTLARLGQPGGIGWDTHGNNFDSVKKPRAPCSIRPGPR